MNTINISLPEKLKTDAEELIRQGYYASFSDLVRQSLRGVLERNRLDLLAEEAEEDLKRGRAVVLKSKNDIKKYMNSLK